MIETNEAHLAKQRVCNATSLAVRQKGTDTDPAIGINGAIVYALLDVAKSIRSLREPDEKTKRLLSITDSIADLLADGADPEAVKRLVEIYRVEREGTDIDQFSAPYIPE